MNTDSFCHSIFISCFSILSFISGSIYLYVIKSTFLFNVSDNSVCIPANSKPIGLEVWMSMSMSLSLVFSPTE